ncbi:MAG: DUF3048 domain-containing protein [Defluviitaleaceae bacterium]|nr:DUF3048 domain-containing protein [Defluviitaleaceae bacterium]
MKILFENFSDIVKRKSFLISFGASLGTALIFFTIIFFATREKENFFSEEIIASEVFFPLKFPVPDGWFFEEEEPADERPFSILTGEKIDEEFFSRRPLAVVVNNIRRALPQSGIASADLIYEMLAEGDVTRLVAIFQSNFPEKIGSIRSTRDYFVDFAYNHDAIFIYHGGSPSGYAKIRSTGITNLDGGQLEGKQGVFWRDTTYPDWGVYTDTRPREHSSYTGREQLETHFSQTNIRNKIGDDKSFGFNFGKIPAEKIGDAKKIIVPFSQNYRRTFIFCDEEKIYLVENRDGAHRDALDATQVSVANVLIQFAAMNIIAGDEAGRRNIRTVGEGMGRLAANGEYFSVRWTKDSAASPTRWYFDDGTPLVLSPGKTWVCVFQTNGNVSFENE